MARVEVASQAWGYVVDRRGRPKAFALCAINTTVYEAASGAGTIAAEDFKSNAEGVLPGFVEAGTYTLTEPDGDTLQVEAASGTGGGGGGSAHVIEDEGVALTQRANLNFTGAGVTAADSGGKTVVTIPGGGSGGVPEGWYDVKGGYGAVGNGTTDDTTAVQNAITAAKAAGGTVYFPPGTYKITSTLNCNNSAKGFRMTGPSGMGQINVTTPTLNLTAATGSLLQCHSIHGFELDHLRLTYDHATYNGDLIDIDGNPLASDCTNWRIHNISTRHLTNLTARSIIRTNKAIIGAIHDCSLAGATNVLRIGDPGGSYTVGLYVERNTFNYSAGADCHILIGSGDAETIVVRGNVFEASTNTGALRCATTARDGANASVYGLTFENNWMGDTGAATDWIVDLRSNGTHPMTIRGNRFADNQGGKHVSINDSANLILQGNEFAGGTVLDGSSANFSASTVLLLGNYFNAVTYIFTAGAGVPRPGAVTMLGNTAAYNGNNPQSVYNTPFDTLSGRVAIGSAGAAGGSNFPGSGVFNDTSDSDDTEQLVIGAHNAGTLVTLGNKAGIYTYVANNGPNRLALQASNEVATAEVQIVAGTTPTPVVRASEGKLAFHNTAPVTKPTVTGERNANPAVASALSALASQGLITDSTTAGSAAGGGIPATLLDAKGDVIVASAADTAARLPVGTNGQVLTADSAEATGVKWAAAGGTSLPAGTSIQRIVTPQAHGSTTSVTLTAGRAYFARFVPAVDMTAVSVLFAVAVAAGADDACDVGLYDGTGTRLSSSGATTGKINSTGVKSITISQALTAGTVYYVAFAPVTPFGGSAAQLRGVSVNTDLCSLFGASGPHVEQGVQNAAYPLPASLTIGSPQTSVPVLAVAV